MNGPVTRLRMLEEWQNGDAKEKTAIVCEAHRMLDEILDEYRACKKFVGVLCQLHQHHLSTAKKGDLS